MKSYQLVRTGVVALCLCLTLAFACPELLQASGRIEKPFLAKLLFAAPDSPISLPAPKIPAGKIQQPQQSPDNIRTVTKSIESGDTVSELLQDHMSYSDMHAVCEASQDIFPLTNLRAGKELTITLENNEFKKLTYPLGKLDRLVISKTDSGFFAEKITLDHETRVETVHGAISYCLFNTLSDIGEEPALAVKMEEIYQWNVDFFRDLQKGDSFSLLVEKKFRDNEFIGYGDVLAAEMILSGKRIAAFRHINAEGNPDYFDNNGDSLRKAFLKAPLSYTRISSGYNLHRLHPIHKVYKEHPAIDYAAPTGTPVMAVCDGVVTKAMRKGGNGNYVAVRHANGYESYYLHLSKYGPGIKAGVRVSQSQVIGYVGATGYATGPHLDFRVKKNGSWINPNTIQNDPAEPLPKTMMGEYTIKTLFLEAQLLGNVFSQYIRTTP